MLMTTKLPGEGGSVYGPPMRKLLAVVLSLGLVLLVGLIDYATGYEIRVFIFYFLPVGLAAWFAGRAYGLMVAVVSALTWMLADTFGGHVYAVASHFFWNAAIQLGTFAFAALTVSTIAADVGTQRSLIGELSEAIRRLGQLNEDLSREKAETERMNLAIKEDLDMARVVQQAMIPRSLPQIAELDIAIEYRPARQIGGDVLNIYPIDRHRTVFFVGDVMGHGVQAALVMASVNAVARRIVFTDPDPARALAEINKAVFDDFKEHYVTGVWCVVDTRASTAIFSIAGHPKPYCVGSSGHSIQEIGETNLLLGFTEDATYDNVSVPLTPGDTVVFYTDGVVDARSPKQDPVRDRPSARAGEPRRGNDRTGDMRPSYHGRPRLSGKLDTG